jgi:DNA-directed RNA polymerase subunit RPC12/RpoP
MDTEISFKCIHCGKEIDADISFAGQEVECPGCSGTIKVPEAAAEKTKSEQIKEQFTTLANKDDKELENCFLFAAEYADEYCPEKTSDKTIMQIVFTAYKEGLGKDMAKRYENAIFANSMKGSHTDKKELHSVLFSNKKLNKPVGKLFTATGVTLKKRGGLFGIFG